MQRIRTGRPLEERIGFSRAVRTGPFVVVSGTAPTRADGTTAGGDDPEQQARACLEVIRDVLAEVGASLSDVCRTRMYLVRTQDAEAVGRAHAEAFANHPPAATMVVVQELLRPEWLVEIEAEAYLTVG